MLVEDHLKYDDPVLDRLNKELQAQKKNDKPLKIGIIYLGR